MKSTLFKTFGILLSFSMVVTLSMAVLAADPYPDKPVRLVVPYPPGGGTDITARLIATKLSESLGKHVVVDNRGGAGGIVGAEVVAKAAPDGYTLLIVAADHTIQPALRKLPYDAVKSFTPIAKLASGPHALTVQSSVPANSVKELVALAKQKPGQLIFANSGYGSSPHMSAELFKIVASIDFMIVPFKGLGPALIDLLGGQSHAMISSMLAPMPHIRSGKLRILGIAGVKRSAILPDVPTIAEAGVPGFNAGGWYGILAPAGTPAPIVDRLNNELKAIIASDEVRKLFSNQGSGADYLGLTEFVTFLEEEMTRWASVVKKANIKVE
ncbi:MAG: tripartite tricarboxylate transporter substrate binding protein [Betaproteobacteria bacterium]|nr:tripartite tricarboxylate transporter substrate binding protein [Betaproteobacteria bacterium]